MKIAAASLALVSLALAGCGQPSGEEMKALAIEVASKGCMQQASASPADVAELKAAGVEVEELCSCSVDKMFKDVPASKFESLTNEEEATAFVATLEGAATKAGMECAMEQMTKPAA